MSEKLVIVMDCGATNVRSVAIDQFGTIHAIKSLPNNTRPDPKYPQYLIWDVNEIWDKLSECCNDVIKQVDSKNIVGVTVTTFGVDGAPMTRDGQMLFPVISWQCPRTKPIMENIGKYIDLKELYNINGVQPAAFNTINKLIWLRENEKEIYEKMDAFVFIPSLILHKLSGVLSTDTTMAGTSMITDLKNQNFSNKIMNKIGTNLNKFPNIVKPGQVIGTTTDEAAKKTGLPAGISVVACGHDTQFAIFGSGANENIPVLSSGTWEILMVRTKKANINNQTLDAGITAEFDAIPGLYNMGVNAIASGVIEWVKNNFYGSELQNPDLWNLMINEAEQEPAGSNGVFLHPTFFASAMDNTRGTLFGLNLQTTRGSVFRATLEALACLTRRNLEMLEKTSDFKAEKIIVVGGGSKNRLWNQLRADITGIPVELIDQKETTVLGAALFTFAGVGISKSPEEARSKINYNPTIIQPKNPENYFYIYQRFLSLKDKLDKIY